MLELPHQENDADAVHGSGNAAVPEVMFFLNNAVLKKMEELMDSRLSGRMLEFQKLCN